MVSAVVLSYNRSSEVLITIQKLKDLSPALPFPLQIVVVDNGSVDDTSARVKEKHPDITLVVKEKNNGIAGWNEGFKVAKYKYLLVLDDDSHIKSGLIEAVHHLEKNPGIGILALNVTTGPFITEGIWTNDEDLIGFVGCGAIIKKEVYNKVGGFAEWLHVYAHEWEFGIRCLDAGYSIKYFANSNIDHRASNVNRSVKRLLIYSTRNELGILYKYFGYRRWKYIIRMFINCMKSLFNHGILRAYYYIIGTIKFFKMRKSIVYAPVSKQTQLYFADRFWGTKPVFAFIKKKLGSASKTKV